MQRRTNAKSQVIGATVPVGEAGEGLLEGRKKGGGHKHGLIAWVWQPGFSVSKL